MNQWVLEWVRECVSEFVSECVSSWVRGKKLSVFCRIMQLLDWIHQITYKFHTYLGRYILDTPANTGCWSNSDLMLARRPRCWANIKSTLDQCPVLAGMPRKHPRQSIEKWVIQSKLPNCSPQIKNISFLHVCGWHCGSPQEQPITCHFLAVTSVFPIYVGVYV